MVEDTPQMSFLDKAKDVAGDLADKAGDLAEKVGEKIPDSVKAKAGDLAGKAGELAGKVVEKVPDSVKDKAGDARRQGGDLVGKATGKLGSGGDDRAAPSATAGGEPADAVRRERALSRYAPVSGRVRRSRRRPHPPGADGGAVGVERAARPSARRPGVALRRAISACIGMPSTSVIAPRAAHVRVGGDVGHVHHRTGRGVGRR